MCTLGHEQQYFLNAKGQLWDQPRSAIRLARESLSPLEVPSQELVYVNMQLTRPDLAGGAYRTARIGLAPYVNMVTSHPLHTHTRQKFCSIDTSLNNKQYAGSFSLLFFISLTSLSIHTVFAIRENIVREK